LTNAAPNKATHTVKADLAEIAAATDIQALGIAVNTAITQTAANYQSQTKPGEVIIAAGGSIGCVFRLQVLYNATTREQALVCYWDYSSKHHFIGLVKNWILILPAVLITRPLT